MFPLLKRIELEFSVSYITDKNEKWLINDTTVETVVLLSQLRQKPDDYIHVDVDVAELA